MKTFKLFFVLITTLLFIHCENTPHPISSININSYELQANGDTINRTRNNLRQGHWIVFDNETTTNISYTKCPPDSIDKEKPKSMTIRIPIEEGYYKDNKRQGLWTFHNTDGSLKNGIEYKDDLPVKK